MSKGTLAIDKTRRLILAALALSVFLAAMEGTAVSTAMPTVIGDLGGVGLYSWVFTAYMLASTVLVPIYGKAADLFGRRPIMIGGLVLFIAGSVASGLSTDIYQLIVFRTVQGLGAGAIQSTSLTIIGDLFNLEERGKVQGIFAAIWGLSGIAGPLLGGLIVEHLSWQWVFFINLPLGLLALLAITLFYREKIEKHEQRLDLIGACQIATGLVIFLIGANGFSTAVMSGTGIAILIWFVIRSGKIKNPILPMRLFRERLMLIASIEGALFGAVLFSAVTYLPLYVQGGLGGTATEAGSLLTPLMVGWPLASAISGRFIPRLGFYRFVIAGTITAAIGTACLAATVYNHQSGEALYIGGFLLGVGMGLVNTSLVISVQTSVAWKDRGVATASTIFFRTIGGTLAVGILGGILSFYLQGDGGISESVINDLLGPAHGKDLAPQIFDQISHALASALRPVFLGIFALSLLGVAVSFAFPRSVTQAT